MQDIVFRLVLICISAFIFSFEYALFAGARRRWGQKRWFRTAAVLFWSYAANAKLPFLLMVLLPRRLLAFSLDGPLTYWYFGVISWAYPMFFLGLGRALVRLVAEITRLLFAAGDPGTREAGPLDHPIGRRELLQRATGAVPLALHVSLLGGMIAGSREFLTNEIQLPIRGLHEDLIGFRLVQISDLHVGMIVSGRYLDVLGDVLRSVPGDLLTVTGDILDNNNAFIPEAGRFFRGLSGHFGGMVGVLGNHDYIDDAHGVYARLPRSGLELLKNRSARVRRGRGVLQVLGMDYPGRRMGNSGERLSIAKRYFRETALHLEPESPAVLLNHHPSDFVFLRNEPLDLVLSGHTHGGQMVFTDERESLLAPASLFFPYYRGMYREGKSRLYVSSGVGHWLPLRVNTPPEITVFQLERA